MYKRSLLIRYKRVNDVLHLIKDNKVVKLPIKLEEMFMNIHNLDKTGIENNIKTIRFLEQHQFIIKTNDT